MERLEIFFWGVMVGMWFRTFLGKLWVRINAKLDEWADV